MASTDLHLSQPLTLPSGLTLPNRLVKAAMAEAMAQNGQPSPKMHAAYTQWARGNWGLILTGNVQVDSRHLGQPNDVTVTPDSASTWRAYADAAKENDTKVVMQLCHPGRQSPLGAGTRGFWGKTLAPSAVPLQLGPGLVARAISALVFGTPKAMSEDEIREVVDKFAAAARLAAESGFDGVELHAAHGYLLAQFLSAQSNVRTDGYGGDAVSRARIVVEVVKAVRKVTPKGFTVGIKLNSVDHQSEKALAEVVAQLKAIVEAGVDFVEVSGGSYEDPAMFRDPEETAKQSSRTKAREAFFLEFAQAIRTHFPDVPLMVTGGFRTRQGMEAAVSGGGADLVGIGRAAALNPTLPKSIIFNKEVKDEDAVLQLAKVPVPWILKQIAPGVGAGAQSAWYGKRIQEMWKL